MRPCGSGQTGLKAGVEEWRLPHAGPHRHNAVMASEAVRPLVYLTTRLTPLRLISRMLENCLSKFDDNERRVMLVGATALYWAI